MVGMLARWEAQNTLVDWDDTAAKVNGQHIVLAPDMDMQKTLAPHLRSLFYDQCCLALAGDQAMLGEVGAEGTGSTPSRGIFDDAALVRLEHTREGVKS